MAYVVDPANRRVDAQLGASRPRLDARIERPKDLRDLRRRWADMEAIPVFLEDRKQGLDHSWGRLDVRTLLCGEQSAGRFSAHSLVIPPGAGLPPHFQEDAHVYLFVMEGQLELSVGRLTEAVERYGFGYAPPRSRHGFRNRSDASATLIAIYSPGGAERAFEAAHSAWSPTSAATEAEFLPILERYGFRFDACPLDNDQRTNVTLPPVEFEINGPGDLAAVREAFYRRPAAPRLVRTPPAELGAPDETLRKQLLVGDDSAGQAMVHLLAGTPGFGAPLHHQPTEEEFFLISEGLLEMTCASETKLVSAGAFAFCPRNCTHGFKNPGPSGRTHFITLNSPAGHERAMAAVRRHREAGVPWGDLYDLSVAGGFVLHA